MDLKSLYKIHPNKRLKQLHDYMLSLPSNFTNLVIGDNVTCIEDRGKECGLKRYFEPILYTR